MLEGQDQIEEVCIMIRKNFGKYHFNHLSTNPTKWSNTLKQFVSCFADKLFDGV